jgi:hypothetical protein
MKHSQREKCSPYIIIVLFVVLLAYIFTMAFNLRGLRSDVDALSESGPMAYAQLSSDITQRPTSDKPAKMQMRLIDAIHGVEFNPEISTTNVKILHDGVYFLMAAPQVGRLNPDVGDTACANFFFTVNNKPLDNSNVTLCHSGPVTKDVIVTQSLVPLHAGDEVSVMISSSDTDLGIEVLEPEDQPIVPSIIFSMFRIGEIEG